MLVKFCKPKHNLYEGCETIRLGTLLDFRKMDPYFAIADPDEGVESYAVDYHAGRGENLECREFLESSGFKIESPHVSVQGITIKRATYNCYIWCCRYTEKKVSPEDGLAFDKSYTSHFLINNAEAFCESLGGNLYQQIDIAMFTEASQKHLKEHSLQLHELQLQCFHHRVQYVDEKQGTFHWNYTKHYVDNLPSYLRPVFTKTNKYRPDSEYRFAFIFICPKTKLVLSVNQAPFDVKIPP